MSRQLLELEDRGDIEDHRADPSLYETIEAPQPESTDSIPQPDSNAKELLDQALDSAAGQLLHHCITTQHRLNTGDRVVIGLSVIVAGASLVLYVPLANEYVKSFKGDLFDRIVFQLGTSGTNFLVGTYATSETLNSLRGTLPAKLEETITDRQRTSGFIRALSLLGVGVFAGVAALPFAFAAEGGIPIQAIVWGTQIFINFLGVNVVMRKQGEFILNLFSSQSKKEHRKVLAAFRYTLEKVVAHILNLREGVPSALTPATSLKTGDEMLAFLAAKADSIKLPPYVEPGILDLLIRVSASLVGTGIVTAGLIGYLAAMEQHLGERISSNDKINVPLTAAFSAPFLNLAAFFATNTIINIAQVLSGGYDSPHLAFRINKAAAVGSMLLLSLFSAFSFAGAVQLINESPYFNGDGPFAPYKETYKIFAIVSSVIFNNYAAQMLMLNLFVKIVRLWGSDIAKNQAILSLAVQEFVGHLEQKMPPHTFANSLKQLSHDQQRTLIPFGSLEYNTITMLDRMSHGQTTETPRNQSEIAPGKIGAICNWLTGRNTYVSEYQGINRRPTVGGPEEAVPRPANYGSVLTGEHSPKPSFWARATSCLPSLPSCPKVGLPSSCPGFLSFLKPKQTPPLSFSPSEDASDLTEINTM